MTVDLRPLAEFMGACSRPSRHGVSLAELYDAASWADWYGSAEHPTHVVTEHELVRQKPPELVAVVGCGRNAEIELGRPEPAAVGQHEPLADLGPVRGVESVGVGDEAERQQRAMGAPAAGVLYSGENDTENPADRLDANGNQIGVMGARDRLIKSNGCDPTKSTPYAANPICTEWRTGCENNPVLYCIGPGDGHGKGDGKFNVSNKAFWDVWSSLP